MPGAGAFPGEDADMEEQHYTHPDPKLIPIHLHATADETAPRAGPMQINVGALSQSKVDPERAMLEPILNSIDASNDLKLNMVRMQVGGFNPLDPTGRDDDKPCIVTWSNTHIASEKMETAMNYGTTRDTEEGHSNQSDGNCFGIGFKEAAIALGGTAGMINMTQTDKRGVYRMSCDFASRDVSKAYKHVKKDSNEVVCCASFQAEIVDRGDGSTPDVSIIYPSSTDHLAKMLLYHSGLDFCIPGSRWDECDVSHSSADKMVAKNMEVLEATIANTFMYTMKNYRDKQIESLLNVKNLLISELYEGDASRTEDDVERRKREDLLQQFASITITFMHNIKPEHLVICTRVQTGLDSRFTRLIEAHRLCLRDCSFSLCSQIASKINFDYYREDKGMQCRDIFVTLAVKDEFGHMADYDVREACPYTQIKSVRRSTKEATGPTPMRKDIAIRSPKSGPRDPETIQYGILNLGQSHHWGGSVLEGELDPNYGTPRIEHTEGGESILSWPGWDAADNRWASPGLLVEMDGIVYNPFGCATFFSHPQEVMKVANIDKGVQSYRNAENPERKLRGVGKLDVEKIAKDMCKLLRIGHLNTDMQPLSPADIEAKINKELYGRHKNATVAGMSYFQDLKCNEWSYRMAEYMTCTSNYDKEKTASFPEEDKDYANKWFIHNMYGMNCVGVFSIDKDAFTQNIDKTCISFRHKSSFAADVVLRSIRRNMMAYCMTECVTPHQLERMRYIAQNIDLAPPRECRKRKSEEEQYHFASSTPTGEGTPAPQGGGVLPSPAATSVGVGPSPSLNPIVEHVDQQPLFWDDMPLDKWLTDVTSLTKPADGTDLVVHKDSNKKGWYVNWRYSQREGGVVKYFYNTDLRGAFTTTQVRTHGIVLLAQKWLEEGGMQNLEAFPRALAKPGKCTSKDGFLLKVMRALGVIRDEPRRVRPRTNRPPRAPTGTENSNANASPDNGGPEVVDLDADEDPEPEERPGFPIPRAERNNHKLYRLFCMQYEEEEEVPTIPFLFYENIPSISKDRIRYAVKWSRKWIELNASNKHPILQNAIKETLAVCMRPTNSVQGQQQLAEVKQVVHAYDQAERQNAASDDGNAGEAGPSGVANGNAGSDGSDSSADE